jgi:hypothetical protein
MKSDKRPAAGGCVEGKEAMLITMVDLRTVPNGSKRGYCAPKLKLFFKRYKLDLREFVRNGLPEEVLLATGDYQAIRLVEWAHERRG